MLHPMFFLVSIANSSNISSYTIKYRPKNILDAILLSDIYIYKTKSLRVCGTKILIGPNFLGGGT